MLGAIREEILKVLEQESSRTEAGEVTNSAAAMIGAANVATRLLTHRAL